MRFRYGLVVSTIKVIVATHLLCGQTSYKGVVVNIKDTITFMVLTKFQKAKHDSGIEVQRDSLTKHAQHDLIVLNQQVRW